MGSGIIEVWLQMGREPSNHAPVNGFLWGTDQEPVEEVGCDRADQKPLEAFGLKRADAQPVETFGCRRTDPQQMETV